MADNGFGVSFLPNGDQRYQRPGLGGGAPGGLAPIQEAIKVISMRVPRVVGANPLAPLALLGGQGAQGLPNGLLEQLLRTLGAGPRMQEDPGAGDPNSLGVGGAPSPLASSSGLMPSTYGSSLPVNVTAGARGGESPDLGASTLPMPDAPTQAPAPVEGPSPSNSADFWDQARRQRESMGRISY